MPSVLATSRSLRNGLAEVTGAADRDLSALWRSVSTAAEAKTALTDVLPALVQQYGAAASTLATEWYDDLRAKETIRGTFRAFPASLDATAASTGSIEALAGVGVGPLYGAAPDWSAAQVLVAGGLQRRIANYARATVTTSAVADPQARGWTRVGDGSSCEFCSMLLGRGGVYSEASADFAAHDHCACGAEPAWG